MPDVHRRDVGDRGRDTAAPLPAETHRRAHYPRPLARLPEVLLRGILFGKKAGPSMSGDEQSSESSGELKQGHLDEYVEIARRVSPDTTISDFYAWLLANPADHAEAAGQIVAFSWDQGILVRLATTREVVRWLQDNNVNFTSVLIAKVPAHAQSD